MNTDLKQRIETMRAKLDERAPVVEVSAASQLFVTPEPACKRLVTLAEVKNTDYILEPSAGTGAILRAIKHAAPSARCDAVELNTALVEHLRGAFPGVNVWCGDFMEYGQAVQYDKIIMNPPFNHAQDIRHIQRALSLLKPAGLLTAICLNGPRQQKILKPLCDVWEELPRGTFSYTDVATAIIRLRA